MRILSLLLTVGILGSTPTETNAQEPDKANKAKIEQRDQLGQKAQEFADSGEFDKATVLFEQVYKLEQTIFGDSHVELLGTLDVLRQVAQAKQDYDAIIEYCERQQTISEKLYGADDYRSKDAVRAVTDAKRIAALTPDERRQLEQAKELNTEIEQAYEAGNYAAGIKAATECLAIFEKVLGKQHPDYALSLNNLAFLHYSMGDYRRAEPLYREAMAIDETVLGKQHPDYATSLNNLALLYYSIEDYPLAEPLYREALAIREKVLGKEHPDYATSLNELAGVYRLMGDYPQAEPLFREALAIREKVLGKQHPNYATSLNSLALLYTSMGDYLRAEPLNREAMAINETVLGKKHPTYAKSVCNLACLYTSMGNYPQAEPLFREALAIKEEVLGKQHPDYANDLNQLAKLYLSMGDYPQAEPLFREAMAIREKVLGKQHPDFALSLNSLALLYTSMGDYLRAEPLYHEAMAINETVLGKQHREYAAGLNNLASLYRYMGDYVRAEALHREAMVNCEKALGKQHPDYAACLTNLAKLLYESNGDYLRAEPLHREAIAIQEKVLGKQHPKYAASLLALAQVYESMGDYPRAEPLFCETIAILETSLGKQHLDYAASLNNLAGLYSSMGDYPRAEPLYREATEITLRNMELTADVQSQKQQLLLGQSLRVYLDTYLTLATCEPRFQEAAYAALLRWKGSVWQRQQRQSLLVDQPKLRPRFEQLQSVSTKLSTLTLNPPAPTQLDAWRRRLDDLIQQRENLERDLSLASVEFRQSLVPVTPEQLRASLPTGTLLVDFLVYGRSAPASKGQQTEKSWEEHLLVHLVRADQEIRAIDLGPVDSLNHWVQTWRRDLGQSREASDAASKLRQRIWSPIEEHLGDVHTVFVSPDGVLGQFPFAALPGKKQGSYLLEDLAVVMLPVPQGLPAMVSTPFSLVEATDDRFCLVGEVDYEQAAATPDKPAPDTDVQPHTPTSATGPLLLATRGGQWQTFKPLHGTSAEIDTIESMLRKYRPTAQTTILRGSSASEEAFARIAPGQRYLHVATHGFFAPETVKNALSAFAPEANRMLGSSDSRLPNPLGQHPDLLSGLVFAGANHEPVGGANDGILTAAEVHSLDLRGVDLVVLSACETGLGQTAGGEGIIGLQRAFQLAGAKTTITSLWQVDDAATRALMVEFYRNLFEKKLGKLESLRQAQLWMLNNPGGIEGRDLTTRGQIRETKAITADTQTKPAAGRSLPAYWGAFQLSGDPR